MEGKFSQWADKQSKYLRIERGEQKQVVWTGDAVLSRGQFGEGWDMTFDTDSGRKIFTIRNTKIISQFDNYESGEQLVIKRNVEGVKPALKVWKDGEENTPF